MLPGKPHYLELRVLVANVLIATQQLGRARRRQGPRSNDPVMLVGDLEANVSEAGRRDVNCDVALTDL